MTLTMIDEIPFDPFAWPGMGIWLSGSGQAFEVAVFTRRFSVNHLKLPIRIHVTADQRYKLYLDGRLVGLGPQRGDVGRWYFDSYDLSDEVRSGEHVLTAVVWHDRDHPPIAQISYRPMFLLAAEAPNDKFLSTGSEWRCRRWVGIKNIPVPEDAFNIGSGFEMMGFTLADLTPSREKLDRSFESPELLARATDCRANDWCLLFPWRLHPRTIPALEAEMKSLGRFRQTSLSVEEFPILIPPHTRYRWLLDHKTLTMGYAMLTVGGGKESTIRLTYQEAMQSNADDVTSKGPRDEIDGRTMVGIRDIFHPDGRDGVIFEPLWFRCWRYIQVEIETEDEGLEINSLAYRTTGYPLELKAEFQADERFTRLIEPGFRTLKLCCCETFMDCPYYEQLQYVGDARIMALLTYVLSGDDRLGRQAIEAFDRSRLPDGLSQAQYPSRVVQVIPTFSLLYIVMVNDFLMWRGDVAFVQKRMFGIESILRAFECFEKDDGLMGELPKWSFIDWVQHNPAWVMGAPPQAGEGHSHLISFLYLYALQQAENLFRQTGDSYRAKQTAEKARHLQGRLRQIAFNRSEQLFIDDPSGMHLSQHTNIMAILTQTHETMIGGQILMEKILNDQRLAQTTSYFSFYLFEAMYQVGRGDLIWPALQPWHEMLNLGLTTFAETPEPTRSDCHGWSVHPLYHYFASVLGVRPSTAGGFRMSIRMAPVLPWLPKKLGGTFLMPQGHCRIDLEADNSQWKVHTRLPEGVSLSFA